MLIYVVITHCGKRVVADVEHLQVVRSEGLQGGNAVLRRNDALRGGRKVVEGLNPIARHIDGRQLAKWGQRIEVAEAVIGQVQVLQVLRGIGVHFRVTQHGSDVDLVPAAGTEVGQHEAAAAECADARTPAISRSQLVPAPWTATRAA